MERKVTPKQTNGIRKDSSDRAFLAILWIGGSLWIAQGGSQRAIEESRRQPKCRLGSCSRHRVLYSTVKCWTFPRTIPGPLALQAWNKATPLLLVIKD